MRRRALPIALGGAALVLGTGGVTVAAEQGSVRRLPVGGVEGGGDVGVVFSGGLTPARGVRLSPRAPARGVGLAPRTRARVTLSSNTTTTPLPPTKPPLRPLRYRPVGCVATGPQEARTHGPRHREVALTFDDGPSIYTRRFVQMLRAQKVVATFFMIGEQVTSGYRGILREELRNGDALGDHTWSHVDLVTSGEVASQLGRTKSAIEAQSGYTPCVMRPPSGYYDTSVVRTARSLGLDTITWEVDPSDYLLPGTAAIEQRVLAQVQRGSIILSHDGGGNRLQTLDAYPHIIAALRARGDRFVTVPQLLGLRTIYVSCRRDCGEAAIEGKPPAGSIVRNG